MIDININELDNAIDNLNGEDAFNIVAKLQYHRQALKRLESDNKDRLKAAMAHGTVDDSFMADWFNADYEIQNRIDWIDGTIRQIAFSCAKRMAA